MHAALAEYICKYATKPEKETTTFKSVLAKVRAEVNNSGVAFVLPTSPLFHIH
jgi:hypothetical protein